MKSSYINGVDHQRSKCHFEIFKFTYCGGRKDEQLMKTLFFF